MAEEVGVAYVSLLPSARGFGKAAEREIRKELRGTGIPIPIKPEVDQRQLTAALAGIGGGTGVTVPIRFDEQQVTRAFTAVGRTERLTVDADVDAGELTGDTRRAVRAAQAIHPTINVAGDVDATELIGDLRRAVRAAQATRPSINVDTDVDGAGIGRRAGLDAGKGFLSSFVGSIKGSLPASPWILLLGAAIGVALAPAIAAALTGALLGGAGLGLIGLGALILGSNEEVAHAAKRLALTVVSVFRDAASPLIQPFIEALEMVRWAVIRWGPQFSAMFELIAPAVKPLTEGLIGFVSNVLPGIVELIRESTPFLIRLAGDLPKLGEYIGVFFRLIDGGGPEASMFFSDLINLAGLLITGIGLLIRVLTELYPVFRTMVMLSPIGAFIALTKAIFDARDTLDTFLAFARKVLTTFVVAWQVAGTQIGKEIGRVVEFVRGLPERIRRALGNTGNLLYQAGKNVVTGLINGIKSMFGPLGNVVSDAAGLIRAYLPFSPAKTGPLSGTGNPFYSGQSIAALLAGGIESGTPLVASASNQLAGSVGVGGGRSSSVAAAGGAQLSWADDATGDQLLDALRHLIAIRWGGSVDRALGG